ncbi:nuclear transport factor 2 family protein [Lacibacter sediminis]|uniref:Nuclear transport factor 2 family protein n=1 Tax=Lacibacter sediminis TaxID=2760713 RepID=A0A7G5XGD2_9BACT|nr:nuclear transport factor 2 family protein [Lacibacter sediminis]QNA44535.1 nuclear transport factor 2 family protein [Lacibacter sediminis]
MIQKLNLLLVLLLLSVITSAQNSAKEEDAVHQTIVKLFDALSKRDSVSLKEVSTADITLYEYGGVWTIDTLILKAIKLNTAKEFARTNTFDFIHTTVDNKMALVNYRLQSIITRDGKEATLEWLETVVLIKVKNQWKVKHLHSTLLKRS